MKIKKYTKLKSNKYNVEIDDLNIKLYDDVIIKFELLRKDEIDETLFKEIIEYNDRLEAYYKALKYISKKLRTEKEMVKYLEKDYSRSVVRETIDKLRKDGYLNEEIYLKSYLLDQVNLNISGPNKIKKDLIKLGIDEEEVVSKISEISDDIWINKLEKIVNKRIKSNKSYGNNKLKEKLLYDLSNLGYYKWMIEEVINKSEFSSNDNLIEKEYSKVYNKLSKKYTGYELETKIISKLMAKGFYYDDIKRFMENKKSF